MLISFNLYNYYKIIFMKKFLKKIIPTPVWSSLNHLRKYLLVGFKRFVGILGYNIARKSDYYSPLPNESDLKKNSQRWNKPSKLTGIDYDIEEFKQTLSHQLSLYYAEFSLLPDYFEILKKGFGPGYPGIDSLSLYMRIRERKPKVYLEIGSGVSTYYAGLALEKNEKEGYPSQIICVEPFPYEKLYSIRGIKVYANEVQDIDISLFQELQENDILFIDSSHVLKIDGDVPFLYLDVLPNLNKGVLIHIHDVPFPYNIPYPPRLWIFERTWPMFWNEAMVLQAFLCFNHKFKIIMSTPLVRYFDEGFLQQNIPNYESMKLRQKPITYSSIWLLKVE